jgi:hypothetical protein
MIFSITSVFHFLYNFSLEHFFQAGKHFRHRPTCDISHCCLVVLSVTTNNDVASHFHVHGYTYKSRSCYYLVVFAQQKAEM